MATFNSLKRRELAVLRSLSNSMDQRVHDINSLSEVLASCLHLGGVDPIPHIKNALKHYLKESE